MAEYIEPAEYSEVNGAAVVGQAYQFFSSAVKIKKIVNAPVFIGDNALIGEEEVFVDTDNEIVQRDLITNIGKYVVIGNDVFSRAVPLLDSGFSIDFSRMEVSDTPPNSPMPGAMWFNTDVGSSFIYYDNFWIEV